MFLDFLDIGIWQKLDTIRDKALRQKAALLPELFKAAFAEDTISKYRSAWHKWVHWTTQYEEVQYCPADPFFICIYFNDLVLENAPISAIITALCGIKWGHINAGFLSPTDAPIVKLAFEGAKRIVGKSKSNQKEPFTAELIKTLVESYSTSENLMHLRFLIICITGFAGFFRISELLDLTVADFKETEDSFEVTVKKSKNDQLREGHIVYIAKTGLSTCPFYWIKRYLRITNLKNDKTAFFICRLAKTKRGHNVLGKHQITYPTARKTFLEHLKIVEETPQQKYGLHSLRSGGASAAANNDVELRLIGKHGRWAPNSATKERYIKDSKKKRLSVSKSLGI